MCACTSRRARGTLYGVVPSRLPRRPTDEERALTADAAGYTPEQRERLRQIHSRVVEARRELDALIGDAYLRPRASIVPVHFLDLASAVEKLRWAEKEWRELDDELAESHRRDGFELLEPVHAESSS
ncbi:MAG: hypothetical protein ABR575_01625 [Actinomycetota bacterium]